MNEKMNEKLNKSILTSYFIGAPIGILVIVLTIFIPSFLSGEGLFSMVLLGIYGKPTIGLVLSFLIALWIGGKLAFKNISKGKSLILTSLKYSIAINLIIWLTFNLIVLITVEENRIIMIIPPIIAFIVCTVLTTFTIGLLVSSKIRKIIELK